MQSTRMPQCIAFWQVTRRNRPRRRRLQQSESKTSVSRCNGRGLSVGCTTFRCADTRIRRHGSLWFRSRNPPCWWQGIKCTYSIKVSGPQQIKAPVISIFGLALCIHCGAFEKFIEKLFPNPKIRKCKIFTEMMPHNKITFSSRYGLGTYIMQELISPVSALEDESLGW
jgi:hypothetical protein